MTASSGKTQVKFHHSVKGYPEDVLMNPRVILLDSVTTSLVKQSKSLSASCLGGSQLTHGNDENGDDGDDGDDNDRDDDCNHRKLVTGEQMTAAPDPNNRFVQILRRNKIGQGPLKPERGTRVGKSMSRVKRFWSALPTKTGHVSIPGQPIADEGHATGGKKGAKKAKLIKRLNPKDDKREDEEFKLECKTELAKRLKDDSFGIHAMDYSTARERFQHGVAQIHECSVTDRQESKKENRHISNGGCPSAGTSRKDAGIDETQARRELIKRAKAKMRLDLVSFNDDANVFNPQCTTLSKPSLSVERMAFARKSLGSKRRVSIKNRFWKLSNDESNLHHILTADEFAVENKNPVLSDAAESRPQITLTCVPVSYSTSRKPVDLNAEARTLKSTQDTCLPQFDSSLSTTGPQNGGGRVSQLRGAVPSQTGNDLRNTVSILRPGPVDLGDSVRHVVFYQNRFVVTQIAKIKNREEGIRSAIYLRQYGKRHDGQDLTSSMPAKPKTRILKGQDHKDQASLLTSNQIDDVNERKVARDECYCKPYDCLETENGNIISPERDTKSSQSHESRDDFGSSLATQDSHWLGSPHTAGSRHAGEVWRTTRGVFTSYDGSCPAAGPQIARFCNGRDETLRSTVVKPVSEPVPNADGLSPLHSTLLPVVALRPPPGLRSYRVNEIVTNGLQESGQAESLSVQLRSFERRPAAELKQHSPVGHNTGVHQPDTINRSLCTDGSFRVIQSGNGLDGNRSSGNILGGSQVDGNRSSGIILGGSQVDGILSSGNLLGGSQLDGNRSIGNSLGGIHLGADHLKGSHLGGSQKSGYRLGGSLIGDSDLCVNHLDGNRLAGIRSGVSEIDDSNFTCNRTDVNHLGNNLSCGIKSGGNHAHDSQRLDVPISKLCTGNALTVNGHGVSVGTAQTDHRYVPPNIWSVPHSDYSRCINTTTALKPSAAQGVKLGALREDPPLTAHNQPLTLHEDVDDDDTAAAEHIDRGGQKLPPPFPNKQKRGDAFAPATSAASPSDLVESPVRKNAPAEEHAAERRSDTPAKHERGEGSVVAGTTLSIERADLNNDGEIAPSLFSCHVPTRHHAVVPAHVTKTTIVPSFDPEPHTTRLRFPVTSSLLDDSDDNKIQDVNKNPQESTRLNRLSSSKRPGNCVAGNCVAGNRLYEPEDGLVCTSGIKERGERDTRSKFGVTAQRSSTTRKLSSVSLEDSPSTQDLKLDERKHAGSNKSPALGVFPGRAVPSGNRGTGDCNADGGFATWDDDNNTTKSFPNLIRLVESESAGNAQQRAVGQPVSSGRCISRDDKPTVEPRVRDLSGEGAWRRADHADVNSRSASPHERKYFCAPRELLARESSTAAVNNGQSCRVRRTRDSELLSDYVDEQRAVNSSNVTRLDGHFCSLETFTPSVPIRANEKEGLNVRSIIKKPTPTDFPDSISEGDRKEKAALLSLSCARCYKVHVVEDSSSLASEGHRSNRVSFSPTTKADARGHGSGNARERTGCRRLTSFSQPKQPFSSSSPTRTTVHLERRPSLTKSDYGPESEPLLVEAGMDGRGIEIIVSDENDARVSTVNSGKRAVLRRIWMILLDNRVAGRPDSERALRPHHEEYRVLKRVLNIIFITIGVALLVSVFVVIIYTYVVDEDSFRSEDSTRVEVKSTSLPVAQVEPTTSALNTSSTTAPYKYGR